MTLKDYIDDKAAGYIKFVLLDGVVVLSRKRFDRNTGVEIDPEIQDLKVESLQTRVAQLQDEIDNLNVMIADIQAIPVP